MKERAGIDAVPGEREVDGALCNERADRCRARIALEIVLGVPQTVSLEDIRTFADALDIALTRIVGGITRRLSYGTWATGAATGDYGGEIERDHTIEYALLLVPKDEDAVLTAIRKAVRHHDAAYDLGLDWIQVTRAEVEERIFRIHDTD